MRWTSEVRRRPALGVWVQMKMVAGKQTKRCYHARLTAAGRLGELLLYNISNSRKFEMVNINEHLNTMIYSSSLGYGCSYNEEEALLAMRTNDNGRLPFRSNSRPQHRYCARLPQVQSG
jgi:hypothetical protein